MICCYRHRILCLLFLDCADWGIQSLPKYKAAISLLFSLMRKRPTGALYIQNLDGEKDENGLVQTYFPSSRGIKTAQYTLALYIDRNTKQLKKSLLFDDVKDPYQLHNLSLEENKEVVEQLYREMGAMLKEINDPWYTEKILSDRIPY